MQEKPANELLGGQGHLFALVVVCPVPIGEDDISVINGLDSAVGDGNAVGIPAKVFKNLLGSGKRPFCIDDPGELCKRLGHIIECFPGCIAGRLAGKDQLVFISGGFKQKEVALSEGLGQ